MKRENNSRKGLATLVAIAQLTLVACGGGGGGGSNPVGSSLPTNPPISTSTGTNTGSPTETSTGTSTGVVIVNTGTGTSTGSSTGTSTGTSNGSPTGTTQTVQNFYRIVGVTYPKVMLEGSDKSVGIDLSTNDYQSKLKYKFDFKQDGVDQETKTKSEPLCDLSKFKSANYSCVAKVFNSGNVEVAKADPITFKVTANESSRLRTYNDVLTDLGYNAHIASLGSSIPINIPFVAVSEALGYWKFGNGAIGLIVKSTVTSGERKALDDILVPYFIDIKGLVSKELRSNFEKFLEPYR